MRFTITRRTTLASVAAVIVVGCLWLLGTAMPASADGGPHVGVANSGTSTLSADSCGGCHRAHTAQGEMLLMQSDEIALCLACHGQTGIGATTNVEGGVQFADLNDGTGTGTVAGALRSGGFLQARIDSGHSSRMAYPFFGGTGYSTTFSSLVGVLPSGEATTSAHLDLDGAGGVVSKGVVWGNGELNSGAGPAVELSCTSCHNPHGNGNYRILNDIPSATGAGFVEAAASIVVADNVVPTGAGAAGTRNYTVQNGRTLEDVLTAADGATAGDYWRRYIPWNLVPGWDGTDATAVPDGGHAGDVPMYVLNDPDNLEGYRSQIRSWCLACHSRYIAGRTAPVTSSGDSIYNFKHPNSRVECTQCHVAHGSNATMIGESGQMTYPGGTAATSETQGADTVYFNSRLLKIDNRGTCQACHDPTGTIPYTNNDVISH